MSRHTTVVLVAGLVVLGSAVTVTLTAPAHTDAPDAPPHRHGGEVASGDLGTLTAEVPGVFWATPLFVCTGEPASTAISLPASCDQGESFTWTLTVEGVADLLRVDFDQPFRQDDVTVAVTSPAGEVLNAASSNTYSGGIIAEDPAAGEWSITLTPVRTNAAGETATSCASDEIIEAADATRQDEPKVLTRCLRLTTGPHNVGAGNFDLRFPIVIARSRTRTGSRR